VLTRQALSDTSTNASGGFNLFVVAGGGGTSLASPSDQFTYT
jgi:hypothetical protein